MVQLKYFGDSRDYFKYDLITYIVKNGTLSNYSFIPMLTNHRIDREGNKTPKYIKGKSVDLLHFIDKCETKDLDHWETWLKSCVTSYATIHPVNEIYFTDETRNIYWNKFDNISKVENALIFVDPDTGLETGTPSYLKKMGREKYILNEELKLLYESLDESSVLMLYQHLPMNKHNHKKAVIKKINQAATISSEYVIAYREDDLAFLFIMKNRKTFSLINDLVSKYHLNSGHKYKSLHINSSVTKN